MDWKHMGGTVTISEDDLVSNNKVTVSKLFKQKTERLAQNFTTYADGLIAKAALFSQRRIVYIAKYRNLANLNRRNYDGRK